MDHGSWKSGVFEVFFMCDKLLFMGGI
jgi:hypothetical protein